MCGLSSPSCIVHKDGNDVLEAIKIRGKVVNNIGDANDTVILSESE